MSLATVAIEEAPSGPRKIVFEASVKAAERIALALDAEEETAPLTVALFDLGAARVESSIYLPSTLAPDFVLDLISQAANGEELASLRVEPVENQDWVTLSQQQRGSVRAGRFIIHGSHERDQHSRYAIEIDAGQAFGTAHHASTQGCLIMLDHISKRRRFARVLDLGTGAGTLAIAASRLGRRKVLASDNDRIAVAVASRECQEEPCRRPGRCHEGDGPWPSAAAARQIRSDLRQYPISPAVRACAADGAEGRRWRLHHPFRHYRGARDGASGALHIARLRAEKTSRSRRLDDLVDGEERLKTVTIDRGRANA